MSGALAILQRNSPRQTEIHLYLDLEEDDAAIAQALEQNQYVSRVWLYVETSDRNADWDHLWRVIATRGNLLHFVLVDDSLRLNRVPADRIRPILQAIQQNASVRVVEFCNNNLDAADLCSFLDLAVHVVNLTFKRCALAGGEQGARDVAAAVQRNTNIRTLKLVRFEDSLDPVLEGLVLNTCINNLVLSESSLSVAMSNALQGVFESTASIQDLELKGIQFGVQSFRPVAHGLINGNTVTRIELDYCTFQDQESTRLLNEIFERKQTLRSLVVKNCFFRTQPQLFYQALCPALRRSDSPLRHIQFCQVDFCHLFPDQCFRVMLEAFAESKLVSFSIGNIDDLSHSQTLADALPSMKIRELAVRFVFMGRNERNHIMQTLCRAVKNNFTLQSVKYQFGVGVVFLDASAGDETLQFYLKRNIRMAQWVDNPATLPKYLWKEATTLAAKAGPETLFRLLRKEPTVLPVGNQKRKRSK